LLNPAIKDVSHLVKEGGTTIAGSSEVLALEIVESLNYSGNIRFDRIIHNDKFGVNIEKDCPFVPKRVGDFEEDSPSADKRFDIGIDQPAG
jgi:hypothetical protein